MLKSLEFQRIKINHFKDTDKAYIFPQKRKETLKNIMIQLLKSKDGEVSSTKLELKELFGNEINKINQVLASFTEINR